MTELSPSTAAPDTSSVALEPNTSSQNAVSFVPPEEPVKEEKPAKAPSIRQALEKANAEMKAGKTEEAKPNEVKAKEADPLKAERQKLEAKPEAKTDTNTEQPEEADTNPNEQSKGVDEAAQEPATEKPKPSEGRGNREPPARFLPREREEWIKAPNVVRDAVLRVTQEYEAEVSEAREAKENWSRLQRFDEMAKQRGVTVERALEHYTGIDKKLSEDLVGGLDHIARQYGYDLKTIASHVLGQPADQQHQQLAQQNQQVIQQAQQIAQQAQQLQTQLQEAQMKIVELETIQPFVGRVGQEKYEQLAPYIANFLNSGMIPSTLSGQQKLEHAFDMAERLFSSSQSSVASPAQSAPEEATRVNPAGEKSIKGSPTPGVNTSGKKAVLSTRDSIKAAAAQLGVSL